MASMAVGGIESGACCFKLFHLTLDLTLGLTADLAAICLILLLPALSDSDQMTTVWTFSRMIVHPRSTDYTSCHYDTMHRSIEEELS